MKKIHETLVVFFLGELHWRCLPAGISARRFK